MSELQYHQELVPIEHVASTCDEAAKDGWRFLSLTPMMGQIQGKVISATTGGVTMLAFLLLSREVPATQVAAPGARGADRAAAPKAPARDLPANPAGTVLLVGK